MMFIGLRRKLPLFAGTFFFFAGLTSFAIVIYPGNGRKYIGFSLFRCELFWWKIIWWRRKQKAMTQYEIILYWSKQDQVYIAEAPELVGCMAHGDTQESALANIKAAMQLWLDAATECGDPIPEPKGRWLMVA